MTNYIQFVILSEVKDLGFLSCNPVKILLNVPDYASCRKENPLLPALLRGRKIAGSCWQPRIPGRDSRVL